MKWEGGRKGGKGGGLERERRMWKEEWERMKESVLLCMQFEQLSSLSSLSMIADVACSLSFCRRPVVLGWRQPSGGTTL